MSKKIYCLILFVSLHCVLTAQTLPRDRANLHYRLVGFSFPPVQKVNKYKIEIAIGNFNTDDSFKKNIVKTVEGKNNKIVAEVPLFGREYTWRSVNINAAGKVIGIGDFHHFSTGICEEVDTNSVRLKVIKKAEQYKDAYVFMDGMRALYDMNGRPVWFLPNTSRFNGPTLPPMPTVKNVVMAANSQFVPTNDLKLTSRGTITFIYFETAYEVDYNGNILWSAPDQDKISGDKHEYYHHEFTRLENGNYLALKRELVTTWWRWDRGTGTDSTLTLVPDAEVNVDAKNVFSRKTELPVVNMYDPKGKILWSWHGSMYFINEDKGRELARCIKINQQPAQQDVHSNSLYFNEKDSTLIIGFRNASRILVLKFPSGKVLNYYGDDRLFCNQHSAHLTRDSDLYLYNNNLCRPGSMPEVNVIRYPGSWKQYIVWNYKCTYEAPDEHGHDHGVPSFNKGGNVIELPDRSMFVNMGSGYSKVFIVNQAKKLLWSAMPQKYDRTSQEWKNLLQYKVSIVTSRAKIEDLIWAAETAP